MSTRRNASSRQRDNEEPQLRVPVQVAREKLTAQVSEGDRLFQLGITDEPSLQATKDLYRSWGEYNVTLLEQLFTTNI